MTCVAAVRPTTWYRAPIPNYSSRPSSRSVRASLAPRGFCGNNDAWPLSPVCFSALLFFFRCKDYNTNIKQKPLSAAQRDAVGGLSRPLTQLLIWRRRLRSSSTILTYRCRFMNRELGRRETDTHTEYSPLAILRAHKKIPSHYKR